MIFLVSFGLIALQTDAVCVASGEDPAALSDAALGGALTTYLKHHRLPLVAADVVSAPEGGRQVILYGFTATEFGKSDAVRKSRRFLGKQPIEITNRIIVRPELAHASKKHRVYAGNTVSPSASATPSNMGDIRAYMAEGQPNPSNEPANQNPNDMWGTVGPLLGIAALVAGAIALGGLGGYGGYGAPPPNRRYR